MVICIFFVNPVQSHSETKVSFYGGISVPGNEMNNIYNSDIVNYNTTTTGSPFKLIQSGTSIGYHLGFRIKAPLNDNLFFFGSFEWNNFSKTSIIIKDPTGKLTPLNFESNQKILPIGAGMQYYFVRDNIGIYILGMVNYNFFTSLATFLGDQTSFPDLNFQLNKQSNRVGISAGAGFEFDLLLFRPMIELRYNLPNSVGKEAGELSKNYFTLSIGVCF